MAELIRRKLKWRSWSRLEQIVLVTTVLIWVGVVLFGSGLYIAIRNYSLEQKAFAQATAIAVASTATATPMSSPTPLAPTPTSEVFPVGWATATPTVTPTPTHSPTATSSPRARLEEEIGPLAVAMLDDPQPTATVTVPPEVSDPPEETDSDSGPPPASRPPDRIIIPSIELDSAVDPIGWYVVEQDGQRYSVWQVADYAVSWHKTSAYPGHSGNVVLNGHHNIKGEVFRYLVDVEVGDRVILYVEGYPYYYEVEEKMILKEKGEPAEVRRENARWIAPTDDERLTMVTCWPYTNNTHRLVVVAKPTSPPPTGGLD